MAVTVSSTSPPRVVQQSGTTVANGAFSPPDSLILAAFTADHGTGSDPTLTISDNVGGLGWTLLGIRGPADSGYPGKVGLWAAVCPGGENGLIVTGTSSISNQLTIFVRALEGVSVLNPIGAVVTGSSGTNPLVTTALTPQGTDGMAWFSANDSVGSGTSGPTAPPSASDATFWDPYKDSGTNFAGATGYKPITSSAEVTFSLTGVGDTSIGWNWVAAEIRAQAVAPPPQQAEESKLSSAMADMGVY